VVRFLWVLTLTIIVSCSAAVVLAPEPSPGLRYAVYLGEPRAHEDGLRRLVQQRVAEVHGDVSSVETTVWWVEGGLKHLGENYGGLCFGCSEIYVLDTGDLCYSSYIHELIHCYHATIEGWRDFKHESKKWWDLVDPLKQECARRGW
jgi:hypothetical protein